MGVGDGLGVNGNFQVGNPLNNNLLFPIIVGLGLLSLFNIVLTIVTPFLTKGMDKEDEAPADEPAAGRSVRGARNIMNLANNVLEAVQKLQRQHEE